MKYFVIGSVCNNNSQKETKLLKKVCIEIGNELNIHNISLAICSPFKDSVDYWTVEGFSKYKKSSTDINIYFINTELVKKELSLMEKTFPNINFVKHPYISSIEKDKNSLIYSWLFCQLYALEYCDYVISIGGKMNGPANMLLQLAELKNKKILPFSFLGGASEQSFIRTRYELQDLFGNDYIKLHSEEHVRDIIKLSINNKKFLYRNEKSIVFISYPRTRPAEADYVETLLRRRNIEVFRDENTFGAGELIQKKISQEIFKANIFIAIWCKEYACSPWCFDEIELALDLHEKNNLKLLIFCVDNTRMIPKRARNILYYNIKERHEFDYHISKIKVK